MLACVYIPNLDEAKLTALLELLEGFSPTLERLNATSLLVDLGVLPDGRRAAAIGQKLVVALTSAGFPSARVGVAESRFVAAVAAQTAAEGSSLYVTPKEQRRFLAPLPISFLPVDAETLRRLDLLGIRTLGAVAKLSARALADQFGAEGSRLAALVRGDDTQPFDSIPLAQALEGRADFETPLSGGDALLFALQQQVNTLTSTLKQRGQLATQLDVVLDLEGAQAKKLTIRCASPLSDATRLMALLRQRLAATTLDRPITSLILSLHGLVDECARPLTFASLMPQGRRQQAIERVLERLRHHQSQPCLMQVVWDSPHDPIPERRAHLQDRVVVDRLRGLYLPKPVQVVADAAGAPHLVKRHSNWVAVDWLVESWEVVTDWWTKRPLRRHYFRVALKNGSILRLFKDNGGWYHQTR